MRSARADTNMGEPERWTARAAPRGTAEGAAGAALRRARDATEPSEENAARLYARVAARRADGARSPWRWRLALALALLLATGGAVGAAGKLLRRIRSAPSTGSASGSSVSAPRDVLARAAGAAARRGSEVHAPAAAVASTESSVTPAGEAGASQEPAVPPGVPAPPLESPAAPGFAASRAVGRHDSARSITEARLLAAAFRALRAGQDPDAALRALDGYERAFPGGALAGEARIARVEALMALGRRSEALALLAAADGGGARPTRNVLVMRGELAAEAGQCGNAVRDFDRILATGARDDAEARALFGRAACRLRGGDPAAGEGDLRRYLERYPNGAFAAAAREALHVRP